MLIALLAVLGVDLIVLVALAALVLGRKRWVRRRPGVFVGVIRAVDGEIDGLGPTWRRGYGRWVRDVLVWTKAPFLFRTELLPVDALEERGPAHPGEVKRLGEAPIVLTLTAGDRRIEVAVHGQDRGRALTPFAAAQSRPGVPAPRPAGTVLG